MYPFILPKNKSAIKILSMSGGATSFAGIAGAAIKALELGYKPDIILGVSSGSIAAIPLALGLFDEMKIEGDELTPEKFFVKGFKPVNKKGKVTAGAVMRILTGAKSLGKQDISHLLRKVITPELWNRYKYGNYADCIVGAVEGFSGRFTMTSLKQCETLDKAIEEIQKSSRIIPIVNAKYQHTQEDCLTGFIDGGFRAHNFAGKFLNKYPDLPVESLVSIFARPKDFRVFNKEWDKNFFSVIERGFQIMNVEISKKDEYQEREEMSNRGIPDKLCQIFMPLLPSTYATGKELKQLRNIAEQNCEREYKNIFGINKDLV